MSQLLNGAWPMPDFGELIARARGADPVAAREARGQLMDSYRHYLLKIANRKCPPGCPTKSPSDVVEETFERAVSKFDQFKGDTEPEWRGWLRSILVNKIADIQPDPPPPIPPPPPPPPDPLLEKEKIADLYRALDKLPEHSRQVVEWHIFDRLPWEQIGRRTGRSADAARQVWRRAIEHLSRLLEPANGKS